MQVKWWDLGDLTIVKFHQYLIMIADFGKIDHLSRIIYSEVA